MKALLPILLAVLLAACGGSSKTQPTTAEQPVRSNLSSLTLVDASGRPLSNATVAITKKTTGPTALSQIQSTLVTDQYGNLVLNNLEPGIYQLTITINGITVTSTIEISENNAADSATVPAPLNYIDGEYVELDTNTLLVAISGIIYSTNGVVANAEVSISGGSITNGSIASDITDDKGRYSLILNIGLDANTLNNLKQSSFRVVKNGFIDVQHTFDITNINSLIGHNIALEVEKKNSASIVYSETFDNTISGATCGSWIADNDIQNDAPNLASATDIETVGWHLHSANLKIQNQAHSKNLVVLAPDDSSNGYVPDPVSGKACWYGQAKNGTGQGNFLGAIDHTQGGEESDGGTSDNWNAGSLTSPALDLRTAKAPLSLTFRSFWEIESVNPNENGFDLMLIEISKDNGATWQNIARLNPLSDPTYGDSSIRAPMPFSNRGFNRAPAWLWQEPIDISDLAGVHNAKIRFVFSTEDEFYNGFRGWLIDDVQIVRKAGTFPPYTAPDYSECGEYACCYEEYCNDPCLDQECVEPQATNVQKTQKTRSLATPNSNMKNIMR